MKKYDNYKDSAIGWLGEIPSHWEVNNFQILAKVDKYSFTGGPFGSDLKFNDYTEVGVRIIQLQNIGDGLFNDSYKIFTSTEKADQLISCNIYPNEIIIAKMADPVARACFIPDFDSRFLMASDGIRLAVNEIRFNSKFVLYGINSNYFRTQAEMNSTGSTRLRIGLNTLKKLKFILPTLEEQAQIASYLDHKTTQIDTLISKKQQFITLLQEERIAVINQAVTKGLDPKVKMKDSGIEWLGEIPEHWEVKKIKYLGKILSGFSFKSDDFIEKDGCRVMKIANIQTMNIDWSDESFVPHSFYDKYSNFQIKKGDLVFALTRPIISTGIKASIVDFDEKILLNQRNAVLKPTNKLNVNWMYYLVFNPRFINHFESLIDKTGQQPNISSSDISNIPIPLPSKEEQQSIIDYISFEEKKINNIIFKAQQEIELLKEYKTALISEVVTGKVDVRDLVLN